MRVTLFGHGWGDVTDRTGVWSPGTVSYKVGPTMDTGPWDESRETGRRLPVTGRTDGRLAEAGVTVVGDNEAPVPRGVLGGTWRTLGRGSFTG